MSYLLVAPACLHATSDWPLTFLHPRCFCLAIVLLEEFEEFFEEFFLFLFHFF